MKPHPVLLAALTTFLLLGTVTVLVSLPTREESPARPVPHAGPRTVAQTTDTPLALLEHEVVAAKVSLASVPVDDWNAPEHGRAGIVLVRWPDGALLAGVDAQLLGKPAPALTEQRTSKLGRIDLDPALASEVLKLFVRVPGFEPAEAEVGPFERRERLPRIALRPLEGWYGRVVTFENEPAPGVPVEGWWIEAGRPYRDEAFQARERARVTIHPVDELLVPVQDSVAVEHLDDIAELLEESPADLPPEPSSAAGQVDDFTLHVVGPTNWREIENLIEFCEANGVELHGRQQRDFVASRGDLRATALTDGDGWYYVPPLEADVHGELALYVPGQEEATDVLRVALPREGGRLPDLVLHRPLELRGRVVDADGRPVEGAVVVPQLATGWSPDLPRLRTDEEGRFVLARPVEPVVLVVERVGFELAEGQGGPGAREGLDGLWDELAAITPEGQSAARLFGAAYGMLAESLLPRARTIVPTDPWQSDVRIVLEPRGPVVVEVHDARAQPPAPPGILGAAVTATYGGLDARTETVQTNAEGFASLPSVDFQWQPMVVRVAAEGFHGASTVVGDRSRVLHFNLRPIDEEEDEDGHEGEPSRESTGRVTGLAPGERAGVVVYPTDRATRPTDPAWSGETGPGGSFRIDAKLSPERNYWVFAWTGSGQDRRAGKAGPFHRDHLRGLTVELEPAVPVTVHLGRFDAEVPHRIQVRHRPFPGAEVAAADTLDLARASDWSSAHRVHAPFGWTVRAWVEREMEGNVPIIDFLRPEPRQRRYKSLRTEWTDWVAASDVSTLVHAFAGGTLRVAAPIPVDLGGVVTDLTPDAPERLYVAALGGLGHWVSPVDGNGWFAFRALPAGRYRLLLYEPPDGSEGFTLDAAGRVLGSKEVSCAYSRSDLLLPYRDPARSPVTDE